ncbi:HEAT repeat domain-containing protein [Clostridium botulinum]|uniref:HEAT repeat domain-containing protein n=1 Tax=Clostridium botulinum TaxID=1491 RepID=A0A6B4K6P4_CLOBO|nr:HEAT repeat domain-containing protein [Clostridium botulinum]NFD83988.1 HEAT repeat domain-containing protein [Clostridium botulinum]NFE09027.1 HEAT repeat domain-containing protein [Clostridium botulinum]NFE33582.1 HEAT repeat domain-containing protein [Clostridium botulinum]NFE48219.1 HEAT repeat domain-containing protein [Clostridium botulinum]
MNKNLVDIDWNNIEKYSQEQITYFLYLEGKSIETLAKIRNFDKATVKKHILDGKIKYGILAKSSNVEELFKQIANSGKQDKIEVINGLENKIKKDLISFIKNNYGDMYPKDKQAAVWILGELKDEEGVDILLKASVHKFINIRRMAVSALGKIGSAKGETILIRALEDENSQVVTYAIKALKKLRSTKAKEKIIYIKNKTDKDYILKAVDEYLQEVDDPI